jgi:intron-binding protein aquarius
MQYYAPPANELPPAVPENIAVIPSENGSVPNQPNEQMAVEENGGASDTTVGNKMEEDAVEPKDETMQEGDKTSEGNGDGDVAAKDKDDEHADANDKMEEGDSTSKDQIEEETSEPKDKMDEE